MLSPKEDSEDPEEEPIDTTSWKPAFCGFTSSWGSWQSDAGTENSLEFTTTVQKLMDANGIASIDDFGGLIFQIWNVDSKYNGRTIYYKVCVNGTTYQEGETTINSNEYNSTSVLQITGTAAGGDYSFAANDEIYGVVTLSPEATAGIAKANILAASGMEGKNTIPASVSGNDADGAATVSGGDAADAESEEDNVVTVSGNDAE